MATDLFKYKSMEALEEPIFWIVGSLAIFAILCNFYNINTTISLFS
jgi:hypothetical protein